MPILIPREAAEFEPPAVHQANCYLEPAPADEVMMEQLEFLLLHARRGRHVGCSECKRLERIGAVLLAPFF